MATRKITVMIRREHLKALERRLQSLKANGLTMSILAEYDKYVGSSSEGQPVPVAHIQILAGDEDTNRVIRALLEETRRGLPIKGMISSQPKALTTQASGPSGVVSPTPPEWDSLTPAEDKDRSECAFAAIMEEAQVRSLSGGVIADQPGQRLFPVIPQQRIRSPPA